MKTLRKILIQWLMDTKLYFFLMRHVVWRLRVSNYYTSFRGNQYHDGYRHLSQGHFILTVDKHKLVNAAIDGVFSHAAYCVSKGVKYSLEQNIGALNTKDSVPPEIVEMVHTGFNQTWFFDLCKEADRVAIFTCDDWDEDHKRRMINAAWDFKDSTYDVQFTLGVKALYCSELVYQADLEASGGESSKLWVNLEDLAGLGRPYISPDGLAMAYNARCVWDSAGELTGLAGPQIREVLAGGK